MAPLSKPVTAPAPAPVPEPAASPDLPVCQKRVSEDAGFVANVRQSMREFIHTPMEGHKACLKAQYHKFIAKFERSAVGKEGQNPVPAQTAVKN